MVAATDGAHNDALIGIVVLVVKVVAVAEPPPLLNPPGPDKLVTFRVRPFRVFPVLLV
jgi:hypothetical protein